MLDVLLLVVPVVAIVLIGFVSIRFGYINQTINDGLSKFVFTVAFPALLFRNLAAADIAGNADFIWRVLTAYYLGALAMLLLGIVVAKFALKVGQAEQSIFAVGSSHSNTILLGAPAILIVMANRFVLPLLLIVGLHALLMAILLTIVARVRAGKAGEIPKAIGQSFISQAKNPIFIALVAGVLYSVFGLPGLSSELNTILRYLGNATVPLGLFCMGGMMVRYKFSGRVPEAAAISALKLVVHPLIVWIFAGAVLGLNNWAWVAALLAAMPVGFGMHNMAGRSPDGAAAASSAIVVSTVLSVVAVVVILYIRSG